jgi:hypothetical protein
MRHGFIISAMYVIRLHQTLTPKLDPEKQFAMLLEHIESIRTKVIWEKSSIIVFVEHNLGFEVRI